MPRVLAIVSFNRSRFVARAVESLLSQTHREVEIAVLDLGTDDTRAVVRARFGDAATLVGCPGISAGRNAAIRMSRADFVALLSSDTIAEPARLEHQIVALAQDPRAAVCSTDVSFCDEEGHPTSPPTHATPPAGRPVGDVFPSLLLGGNFLMGATVLLRRSALDRAFDEDPRISQDYDLWLHLARSHRFVHVAAPLTRYRASTFAIPEDGSVAAMRRHLAAFERHARDAPASVPRRAIEHRRAEILLDLGYQLLLRGSASEARRALIRSLIARPATPRTLALLAATALPQGALPLLRSVKSWTRRA